MPREQAMPPEEATSPEEAMLPEELVALEELRSICLALPEVEERLSHGEPTWFVRGKRTLVMFCNHHHGKRLGFWAPAADGVQEMRIEQDPDTFYSPPYVGVRGWLGVNLDDDPDWEDVEEIVRDAYRKVAPKTLAARLA
nr:MmcQ/YjbR family DNA-binding protein [Catenulispora rubra]